MFNVCHSPRAIPTIRPFRPIDPLRHSVPFRHSVKKFSTAPCILKTRAILIPLEVYLVNSPSPPNSCPVVPHSPVECGGMTPLWHRETSLPGHRPLRAIKPNQTKSNHPPISRRSRISRISRFQLPSPRDPRNPRPSRWPSARTKAKTPAIVHDQGKSRQTPKFPERARPRSRISRISRLPASAFALYSFRHP